MKIYLLLYYPKEKYNTFWNEFYSILILIPSSVYITIIDLFYTILHAYKGNWTVISYIIQLDKKNKKYMIYYLNLFSTTYLLFLSTIT